MGVKVLPRRHGPYPATVTSDQLTAYAGATADDTSAVLSGTAVPVLFPIVLAFSAGDDARADLPDSIWERVRGGVHGEHDVVVHRPLRPGEEIVTWTTISAIRTVAPGTQVVVHFAHHDSGGALAVEQWWTMILLGLDGVDDLGDMPAPHRFPETALGCPLGSARQHVAPDTARRYAEVSGDWSAHHFDIEAARAEGFGYLFNHGLATMAMCLHRVLRIIGVDDPGRVRRAAVRFSTPTPLGGDLDVNAYDAGDAVVFDATSGGENVITHGRLELRS